jgi:hypothetical protein
MCCLGLRKIGYKEYSLVSLWSYEQSRQFILSRIKISFLWWPPSTRAGQWFRGVYLTWQEMDFPWVSWESMCESRHWHVTSFSFSTWHSCKQDLQNRLGKLLIPSSRPQLHKLFWCLFSHFNVTCKHNLSFLRRVLREIMLSRDSREKWVQESPFTFKKLMNI